MAIDKKQALFYDPVMDTLKKPWVTDSLQWILDRQHELVKNYLEHRQNTGKTDLRALRKLQEEWEELEFLRILADNEDVSSRQKLLSGQISPRFMGPQGKSDDDIPDEKLADNLKKLSFELGKTFAVTEAARKKKKQGSKTDALKDVEIEVPEGRREN